MTRKSLMWMSAAMLALGIGLFSTNTASAGWGISFGLRDNSCRGGNFGYQNRGFRSNRDYGGFSNWGGRFDRGWSNRGGRGHYDYHPPEIRRHGNHFDITPGHYDYHRGGHHRH